MLARVISITLLAIASMAFPSVAAAKSFPADCDDTSPPPTNNARYWTEKLWPGAPFAYYNGAVGTLDYDELLRPCTQLFGGAAGFAAIFPANLDRLSISSSGMVQLGMMRYDSSHQYQGEPVNQTFFVAARVDNSVPVGVLYSASSWAGYPLLGRDYRFRITSVVDGPNRKWQFQITDLFTGVIKNSPLYSATFYNGTRAWYLYETLNGNSQLGADDGNANGSRILDMQYLVNGAWSQYLPSNLNAIQPVSNYQHNRSTAGTGSYWAWTVDN